MASDNNDGVPGIIEFLNKTLIAVKEFGFDNEKYPHDYGFTGRMLKSIRLYDVSIIMSIAVVFTLMRYIMSKLIFIMFHGPYARFVALKACDADKMPESAWRLLAYAGLWCYSLYVVVLSGEYDFYSNPCSMWKGVVFDKSFWYGKYLSMEIPFDIYVMYMLQLGFYVHSIYTTLFMDTWRKDSIGMLFHHFLTIFLLEFSFLMKYYKVGALVLFLHDVSDVLLEFTKLNVYLKNRDKDKYFINDLLSTIGFISFAISWAYYRLYLYPLKVLHSTNWCVYVHQKDKDPKMYLFFNMMLLMLLFLHFYWFYFIIVLMVKIVTGQLKEIEDTREFETDQKIASSNGLKSGEDNGKLKKAD